MSSRRPSTGPQSWRTLALPVSCLLVAGLWLTSRLFVNLDLSDEMQYYGEIASLTRTGRFFQVDLFLQQLGYLFLLPLFRLHAWVFPDQSYLVLFGRIVLLGGYAVTGWMFWRAGPRLGTFTRAERLMALATFVGSAPFLIFAPSYNSLAHLLGVAVVALALPRTPTPAWSRLLVLAALLAVLMFVYPPVGIILAGLTVAEAYVRHGVRAAGQLLVCTAAGGLLVLGIAVGLHGADFLADLQSGIRFSRTFGLAQEIRRPAHTIGLLALILTTAVFWFALRRAAARAPFAAGARPGAPARREILWAVVTLGGGVIWYVAETSLGGYAPTTGYLLLLMLATAALRRSAVDPTSAPTWPSLLVAGSGAAVLFLSVRWTPTTYYFATIYGLTLTLLAALADPEDREPVGRLALVGTVLGAVFSVTSGNGLHNFGLGAASVLPFLSLFAARRLASPGGAAWLDRVRALVLPAVVGLALIPPLRLPYREESDWTRFQRVTGVPAFAGIYTSPPKLAAIRVVTNLIGSESLVGRRVLVAGPHPWIYFVCRGVPTTPMLFMHFTGKAATYDWLAERMFLTGEPEAVFVTNGLPTPLKAKIVGWSAQDCTGQMVRVPPAVRADYEALTRYELSPEMVLLKRSPRPP